jgi:thioredoxin-like negative regulator of GroEL
VLESVTPGYEGNIKLYKVDIQEEPDIANLFGVRSIPAMSMIRKDGKTESMIGAMNPDQLKYWLDGLSSD